MKREYPRVVCRTATPIQRKSCQKNPIQTKRTDRKKKKCNASIQKQVEQDQRDQGFIKSLTSPLPAACDRHYVTRWIWLRPQSTSQPSEVTEALKSCMAILCCFFVHFLFFFLLTCWFCFQAKGRKGEGRE